MTASAVIAPTATTRPVRVMTFMVAPSKSRTRTAAVTERAIVAMPIKASRQFKRNMARARTIRTAPSKTARVRLADAPSMNVAALKSVVSISTPDRPGRSSSSASSRSRVTERVLVSGNFSTTSRRAAPLSTNASPIIGGCPSTISAISPRRRVVPSTATSAKSSGDEIGKTCLIPSRCVGVSIHPPVPGTDAFKKLSVDTHNASPVVLTT